MLKWLPLAVPVGNLTQGLVVLWRRLTPFLSPALGTQQKPPPGSKVPAILLPLFKLAIFLGPVLELHRWVIRPGIKLTTIPNLVPRSCAIRPLNLPTWLGTSAVKLGLILQQLPTVHGDLVPFPIIVGRLGPTLQWAQPARAVRLTTFAH